MSVEFPSCYTFLANNATSSSQHSTWCFVNFLLENNRFSHLLQFPVHATAHHVCWISFLSINRFLHTLCSCYSTWCLLNFPLVITRFSGNTYYPTIRHPTAHSWYSRVICTSDIFFVDIDHVHISRQNLWQKSDSFNIINAAIMQI